MCKLNVVISPLLISMSLALAFTSCGKKGDGSASSFPYVERIALGHQAIAYGLTVLGSTKQTAPVTSLDLLQDFTAQDPSVPSCSTTGEPWLAGAVMQPSHEKYAPTVMYCEVNSKSSSKNLAGSIEHYRRMVCDVERSIGSIEYTEEGKEYPGRIISITDECGWPEDTIQTWRPVTAKVTAYAPSSGDWQKRLKIEVSQKFTYELWFTVNSSTVAFKVLEEWNQAYPSDGTNDSIAKTATGARGTVFSLDANNGIMRTESIDTYWGRRLRYYAKGSLDNNAGTFTGINDGQALASYFDRQQSGFRGHVATMDGNDTSGFYYGSYDYSSSLPTDIRGSNTSVVEKSGCSVSGGCADQTHITFGKEGSDFDYLMIGAAWDSQINSRLSAQSWLVGAGLLSFASVNKGKTL